MSRPTKLLALALIGAVALLFFWLQSNFITDTIDRVVLNIVVASGLSSNLVRGLVILVTIPFFWAIARYTRKWYHFGRLGPRCGSTPTSTASSSSATARRISLRSLACHGARSHRSGVRTHAKVSGSSTTPAPITSTESHSRDARQSRSWSSDERISAFRSALLWRLRPPSSSSTRRLVAIKYGLPRDLTAGWSCSTAPARTRRRASHSGRWTARPSGNSGACCAREHRKAGQGRDRAMRKELADAMSREDTAEESARDDQRRSTPRRPRTATSRRCRRRVRDDVHQRLQGTAWSRRAGGCEQGRSRCLRHATPGRRHWRFDGPVQAGVCQPWTVRCGRGW